MDISFEQLKSMVVFSHIVEQGSLISAAKHIGLSRAVVSYHLKKLESQFGVKLLNRTTRSMTLTEAGKLFYQRCRVITEQASVAQKQIEVLKNEPEGLVKITCPVNVGLELIVPALNEFRQQYKKIDFDVNLTDEVVNIIQEGVDLAIRGAPLPDSELQATRLATLKTCLCGSTHYLNKVGRPKTPADLNGLQWVVYKQSPSVVKLEKDGKNYSVTVKGGIATNNAAARTAFVVGGHGIGRIPYYDASPKIEQGKLELLLEDYALNDINIYAVFPSGMATTNKFRLLLEHLKSYFSRQEKARMFW